MKKLLSFLSFGLLYLIVFSCVDPNPTQVYGVSYQDIPGPRYLYKVEYANLLQKEYTMTSGQVSRMNQYVYNGTAQTEQHKLDVAYSGNKVSLFDFTVTVNGNPNVKRYKYIPTYDSSGKMVSYVMDGYTGTTHITHSLGEITYDVDNKVSKIFEKTSAVTTPNAYNYTLSKESNLIYNFNNIAKINYITKNYNPTTGAVVSSSTDVYEYPQYDTRVNPYSVFSKEFRLLYAAMDVGAVIYLSPNNPLKFKFSNILLPTPTEVNYAYEYDQQGYPTSNGTHKFLYKPIP